MSLALYPVHLIGRKPPAPLGGAAPGAEEHMTLAAEKDGRLIKL